MIIYSRTRWQRVWESHANSYLPTNERLEPGQRLPTLTRFYRFSHSIQNSNRTQQASLRRDTSSLKSSIPWRDNLSGKTVDGSLLGDRLFTWWLEVLCFEDTTLRVGEIRNGEGLSHFHKFKCTTLLHLNLYFPKDELWKLYSNTSI